MFNAIQGTIVRYGCSLPLLPGLERKDAKSFHAYYTPRWKLLHVLHRRSHAPALYYRFFRGQAEQGNREYSTFHSTDSSITNSCTSTCLLSREAVWRRVYSKMLTEKE